MIILYEKQWLFLKKSAAKNKLSHGYLFSGPSGIGKKTLGLEFAKLVNCETSNSSQGPCNACKSCSQFDKKIHPDLLLVENPVDSEESQIDLIRNLNRWLFLKPISGKYKVAIIDNADYFSWPAQSALLKILEEPPQAVIILIAEHKESLLPTICSRVQEIKFSLLPLKAVEKFLTALKAEPLLVKRASIFSFGRPAKALALLSEDNLKNQEKSLESLAKLFEGNLFSRFQAAKILSDDAIKLKDSLEIWVNFLRLGLLYKTGCEREEFEFFSKEKIFQKLKSASSLKLKKIILLIEEINTITAKTNVNPRLALEELILESI